MSLSKKVTIVGSGNVGSAIGHALEVKGEHDVLYYDVKPVWRDDAKGTLDFEEAFDHAEYLVVCVPTETAADGWHCDLSVFHGVVDQYVDLVVKTGKTPLFVQKSTCPPGTALGMIGYLSQQAFDPPWTELYIANPSFLNMGTPKEDEMRQLKLLVGVMSFPAKVAMEKLYWWASGHMYVADPTTVELAKYANNLFHAAILSLWNELFMVAGQIGADADFIAATITREPGLESVQRVFGKAFGGPCLPKDTAAMLAWANDRGYRMPMLTAIRTINDFMEASYGVQTAHWAELIAEMERVREKYGVELE